MQADKPAEASGATGWQAPDDLTPTLARHLDSLVSILSAAPVGAAIWLVDGELVWANPVLVDLLELWTGGSVPPRFESFTDVSDGVTLKAHLDDVLTGRRNYFECDLRCRLPGGQPHWIRTMVTPVYGPGGTPQYLLSQVFDFANPRARTADGHEAGRGMEDERDLFGTIAAAGSIAVVRADRDGNIIHAGGGSPEFLAGEDSLIGLDWRAALLPEHVDEIVSRGLASIESRLPYTVRIRTRRGRPGPPVPGRPSAPRWAELRVAPVLDADGSHEGFVATLGDVSAEVAAGERADQLARVLDAGSDFLMIADRAGTVSYVNDAALHVLGVRAPTPGMDPSLLAEVFETESLALFREVVEPALAREGIWRGELTFRGRRGRQIPVSALFLAHQGPRGTVESISTVARDITDLKDAERRLRQLATHDYLTGLPNRVLLYDRLEQAVARFQRHGQAVALLYLDLDRFKPVNDQLGHQVGDAVLVQISDRIHTVIRETETAARIGGDEFAVLIEGVEDPTLLRIVADRLIETISMPISIDGHRIEVGASIGLVVAGPGADAPDSLMAAADAAMYRAKAAGRGRYEFVGGGPTAKREG